MAAPAAALTTLEATDLNVVSGEARVTIRFTGDDDTHAGRVAAEVRAAGTALAELGPARVTRRDGSKWKDVDLSGRSLTTGADIPLVLRHGYSADQMRAAEKPHLDAGEPLMQRAAAALADTIRGLVADRHGGALSGEVLVLVGPGNNGADALFAAAELRRDGLDTTVVRCAERIHAEALASAEGAGAVVLDVSSEPRASAVWDDLAARAARADVVVDGLFGIGASGRAHTGLDGAAREAVLAVQPAVTEHGPDRPLVVAVDVPSGIGADDGSVPMRDGAPDAAVLAADLTVTFGAMKAGLLRAPARTIAGDILVVDIGLEDDLSKVTPLVRLDG